MDAEKLAKKSRKRPVADIEAPSVVRVDYGRDSIQKLIPHRDPFLLVDKIDGVDFEQKAIFGRTTIAQNDPILTGHFPGYPIYPGVLQVEMIGQLAICYYVFSQDGTTEITRESSELNVRALKIHHTLFQHELLPGDEAVIVGKVLEADEFKFKGIGQVIKGSKVCTVAVAEFFIVE